MTAQLPRPQSIWRQLSTNRLMRVIYSEAHDVIAHDAERVNSLKTLVSWRGTSDQFFADFQPADPNLYPKTAS